MHRKDLGIAALLGVVTLIIVGLLLFPAFSFPPEKASSHEDPPTKTGHTEAGHTETKETTDDVLRLSKKSLKTSSVGALQALKK